MSTKICNKCGIEQETDNFHRATRNRDGFFHTCKTCRVKIDRKYYEDSDKKIKLRQKQKFVHQQHKEYKKGKSCIICGEFEICCLDYHHINPDTKSFTISQKLNHVSWKRILEEIKKCVVLCANCHKKVHAGILELPTDFGTGSTKAG